MEIIFHNLNFRDIRWKRKEYGVREVERLIMLGRGESVEEDRETGK